MARDHLKVGIVVPKYLQKDRLFGIEDATLNRDDVLVPFHRCRELLHERGIWLETCDQSPLSSYDALIFFCHDRTTYLCAGWAGLLGRSIYVAWEPPTVDPLHSLKALRNLSHAFGRILTWNEDLLKFEKFGRIRYAQSGRVWQVNRPEFSNRKLLANISGDKASSHPQELYSERRKILRHFQDVARDQLALYGPGWDINEFPSYRGMAQDKANAYAGYRFALCFENMRGTQGYVSEKIFDCFRAGIVPIYFGAPDITNYVPEGSFVAYNFEAGPQGLLDHILTIDEATHAGMLEQAKLVIATLEDGPFSPKAMADDLADALEALSGSTRNFASAGYLTRLMLRNLGRKFWQ